MHGVRDVDGGERVALDRSGVHRVDAAHQLQDLELYVHLDLDVIDPAASGSAGRSADGMTPGELRAFLDEVCATCTITGTEITAVAPGQAQVVADVIAPLLSAD